MKKIFVGLALFFFASALVAFADESIVEVAKKEKERRAKIAKPAKVITNKDIEEFKAKGNVTAGTIENTSGTPGGAVPDFTPMQESKDAAKDEDAMRQQVSDAQRKLDDAQEKYKRLQARANTNLYNPGISQLTGQAAADADELAQAKQAVDDAQAAAESAQDAARRAGVRVQPPQ